MAEVANKFNLDSTYFVAFEMAHEASCAAGWSRRAT